jgi:hypothetical protein
MFYPETCAQCSSTYPPNTTNAHLSMSIRCRMVRLLRGGFYAIALRLATLV